MILCTRLFVFYILGEPTISRLWTSKTADVPMTSMVVILFSNFQGPLPLRPDQRPGCEFHKMWTFPGIYVLR
ncbi:hypothetical protein EDD16DRAFT_1546487 [Pisolithus croceorrhizus]|nr:hypothetical protein EDD16DRAFT_1546487 [Pisolithus croceorrhizus]